MRAAAAHVIADAAVSGLVLARLFGWTWMDPAAGIIGAVVIASCHLAAIAEGDQLICGSGAQAMVAERLSPVRRQPRIDRPGLALTRGDSSHNCPRLGD